MRNPFRISFFHPKFCINRLVGADHHKPKLRISTNLRSWTKFASSEHANENCTKIAQILRHMDESCTKIARIASDEKCAEIARKIARKIQSGQLKAALHNPVDKNLPRRCLGSPQLIKIFFSRFSLVLKASKKHRIVEKYHFRMEVEQQ